MVLEKAKKLSPDNQSRLEESQQNVSRLDMKIRRRGENKPERLVLRSHFDYVEPIAPGLRKKLKKRAAMSVSEKIEIVHQVLVDHELEKDVAREHRVGHLVVHLLVKKAQRNQHFIQELINQRERGE